MTIPIVIPLIGEPTLGTPPENPDFSADYIFCNNLYVKNGVTNVANRDGIWPWGRSAGAGNQALNPGTWTTLIGLGGNNVGPITEGTVLYWISVNFQDTSGTNTNTIQLRFVTSDLAQVLTLGRCTPVANGYSFVSLNGSFYTPGVSDFILQANPVSGASVRGQEAGVSGPPSVMTFLHLGRGNFGNLS